MPTVLDLVSLHSIDVDVVLMTAALAIGTAVLGYIVMVGYISRLAPNSRSIRLVSLFAGMLVMGTGLVLLSETLIGTRSAAL